LCRSRVRSFKAWAGRAGVNTARILTIVFRSNRDHPDGLVDR
jgi:hypothetical protein